MSEPTGPALLLALLQKRQRLSRVIEKGEARQKQLIDSYRKTQIGEMLAIARIHLDAVDRQLLKMSIR